MDTFSISSTVLRDLKVAQIARRASVLIEPARRGRAVVLVLFYLQAFLYLYRQGRH